MVDPLLSLSFNLHAQRGTYALLIGSGVSRSASIPTGWEVTLDLVAKLAHLQGEDCKGDEAGWYTARFGKDPDYSEVVSAVASTSAAQQQLLKGYFEPTSAEREEGKKLPTAAHKAIARLVAGERVRVIVTPNFDRLLEGALEAEGIAPVVIASPDAAKGAPPIAHSKCTVIKVHGDYLDHRIKNSPKALSKYDRAMDRLLDQVFDEYGLIVCGWSGEYDIALRRALERSKTRRYPIYWTGLSEPRGAAKDIVALHSAHFVKITGADAFFTAVLEKVEALDEFDRPHPISTQAAVVTLKRYLSEDKYRIQLHDFLVREAEQARSAYDAAFGQVHGAVPSKQSAQDLMKRLEASCEKMTHLFATGSFHARPDQAKTFFDAFNTIVVKAQSLGGYEIWIKLGRYPALLLAYAAGIAAVASESYAVLREIASRPISMRHSDDEGVPAPAGLYTHSVMDRDVARQYIDGMDRHKTPVSNYLCDHLRPVFRSLVPDDTRYQQAFDDFEYIWCLLHVDAEIHRGRDHVWTPYGSFIWRRQSGDSFAIQAQRAISGSDNKWSPLRAGLFGGDLARLKRAKEYADEPLSRLSMML